MSNDGRAAGPLPRCGACGSGRPGARGAVLARRCAAGPRGGDAVVSQRWRRAGVRPLRGHRPALIDARADVQISLGDFVTLRRRDCRHGARWTRWSGISQPGVLNDEGSHQMDSFNTAPDGLCSITRTTRAPELGGPRRYRRRCCPVCRTSRDQAVALQRRLRRFMAAAGADPRQPCGLDEPG